MTSLHAQESDRATLTRPMGLCYLTTGSDYYHEWLMRWVVELPAPAGGTAATVTVDAESWASALTTARGGVSIRKFRCEFEEDGVIRVNDLESRERYAVRPLKVSDPPPSSAPPPSLTPPPVAQPPASASPRATAAPLVSAPAAGAGSPTAPKFSVPPPTAQGTVSKVPEAPRPTPEAPKAAEAPKTAEASETAEAARIAKNAKNAENAKASTATETPAIAPPAAPIATAVDVSAFEVATVPEARVVPAPPAEVPPPTPAAARPAPPAEPAPAPAPTTNPAVVTPEARVTAHQLLFTRDQNPDAANPLTYRERVLALPEGSAPSSAEALARRTLEDVQRELSGVRGVYVMVAVFDHAFTARPSRAPLAVLKWKDWRDAVEVSLPPRDQAIPSVSLPPSLVPSAPTATLVNGAPGANGVASPPPPSTLEAREPVPPAAVTEPQPRPQELAPPAAPAPSPSTEAAPSDDEEEDRDSTATDPRATPRPRSKKDRKKLRAKGGAKVSIPAPAPSATRKGKTPTPARGSAPPPATPAPTPAPASTAEPQLQPATSTDTTPPQLTGSETARRVRTSIVEVGRAQETPAATEAAVEGTALPGAEVPSAAESVAAAQVPEVDAATPSSTAPEAAPPEPEVPRKKREPRPTPKPHKKGADLLGELFDGSMELSYVHDPQEAAQSVARLARDCFGVETSAVFLYDIDRDELVLSALDGAEGVVVPLGTRQRLARGPRALPVQRHLAVALATLDDKNGPLALVESGPTLLAPAFFNQRLFAVLELRRLDGDLSFAGSELEAADYLARQLAECLSRHSRRKAHEEFSDS